MKSPLKGVKLVDFFSLCLLGGKKVQKCATAYRTSGEWGVGWGGDGVQYKWVNDNMRNFTEQSDFSVIIFQPLMDNLESQTYEIFERDPIKYREYQRVGYLVFSCWFFKCIYYQL